MLRRKYGMVDRRYRMGGKGYPLVVKRVDRVGLSEKMIQGRDLEEWGDEIYAHLEKEHSSQRE